MSASLVGSEMCIRDSGCPVLQDHELRRHADPKGGKPLLPSQWASFLSGCCLLYTSDAADDM
eukprot:13638717-Alexandrium_andersonii.AAC.1